MNASPHRLPGARWRDGVATFLLRSTRATAVDLCLFDRLSDTLEARRIPLKRASDGLWEVSERVPEGQLYGYRVSGPWSPARGLRFNPAKVLLDPWAVRIAREPSWHDALIGENEKGRPDQRDSAPWAPLGAVTGLENLPHTGVRPEVPANRRIVYEAHLKGLSALHPDVPKVLRGTFAGACHPAIVAHLKGLGVTTLELLPIHHHADDRFLVERGLSNYWGYSTLGYFAPHAAYAKDPTRVWSEFRSMVRNWHDAGIEVILDVVYNHTCEGPFSGPQLSWRGLGPDWYRRDRTIPRKAEDFTGCGNTFDFRHDEVIRFTLESLRFWAEVGGVDGFRYDLASVLGRREGVFEADAPFFQEVAADPVLSGLVHIAEPWDATWGGYAVGRFPSGWMDWNDRFRDDVRRFWRGDDGAQEGFARRMTGSVDLFGARPCIDSLNFVACHDGSTLNDVCSYSAKRNDANGEGNRDGAEHEVSDNLGIEGETPEKPVLEARSRRARNLMATLLMAPGTPMLLGGDEHARTQGGNNNAYCQDSKVSWMGWNTPPGDWPDSSWIGALASLRHSLLEGADWTEVPRLPGVVFLSWRRQGRHGILIAQSGGPMRVVALDGRHRRWIDTATSDPPEPILLPAGPYLLRPSSLVLLESVDTKESDAFRERLAGRIRSS